MMSHDFSNIFKRQGQISDFSNNPSFGYFRLISLLTHYVITKKTYNLEIKFLIVG